MLYFNSLGVSLTFSRLLPIMFIGSDEWFAPGNWSPTEGIASSPIFFYYRVLPFSLDLLIKFWYPSFSCFLLQCSPFGRLRTTRCPEFHRNSGLTLVPSRVRFPDAHFVRTARGDGFNPRGPRKAQAFWGEGAATERMKKPAYAGF